MLIVLPLYSLNLLTLVDDSSFSPAYYERKVGRRDEKLFEKDNSFDVCYSDKTDSYKNLTCSTTILFLVFHAGCILGKFYVIGLFRYILKIV